MRLGGTSLSPIQRTSIAVRICVANLLELAQGYYSIIPFLFLVLLLLFFLFPQGEEDERCEIRDDEDEEEGGWGEEDYSFIIH